MCDRYILISRVSGICDYEKLWKARIGGRGQQEPFEYHVNKNGTLAVVKGRQDEPKGLADFRDADEAGRPGMVIDVLEALKTIRNGVFGQISENDRVIISVHWGGDDGLQCDTPIKKNNNYDPSKLGYYLTYFTSAGKDDQLYKSLCKKDDEAGAKAALEELAMRATGYASEIYEAYESILIRAYCRMLNPDKSVGERGFQGEIKKRLAELNKYLDQSGKEVVKLTLGEDHQKWPMALDGFRKAIWRND